VLLSSHLLADVEDVCDRVCILYGGRQRALGDIDDLLAQRSQTQLVTDELTDDQLQRIREVLQSHGKELREVTAPRDKLESLFLRIVTEAQQRKLATGGALAGGEVPEFLRASTGEGEDVIDQLVSAGGQDEAHDPAEEQAPPEPSSRSDQVDTRQIDQLVAPAGSEPGADETPAHDESQRQPESADGAPPSDRRTDQAVDRADRNVIDDLLAGGDQEESR
jgi:ABC-2 type transport system ATP-binding protein